MSILAVNHPYKQLVARFFLSEEEKTGERTQTIPTGPAGSENAIVDAIEGTKPMILNATAKISRVEYCRRSSCLYPNSAVVISTLRMERQSLPLTQEVNVVDHLWMAAMIRAGGINSRPRAHLPEHLGVQAVSDDCTIDEHQTDGNKPTVRTKTEEVGKGSTQRGR